MQTFPLLCICDRGLELHAVFRVSRTGRFDFVGELPVQIASPEANHGKGMPEGRHVLVQQQEEVIVLSEKNKKRQGRLQIHFKWLAVNEVQEIGTVVVDEEVA